MLFTYAQLFLYAAVHLVRLSYLANSQDMSNPPPLPPINDQSRRERVFRHKGLPDDNEKLALIGAVVMQMSSLLWSIAALPDGAAGDLTELKATIVNESMTSAYTRLYGLQRFLLCAVNVNQVRETPSVQSRLFHAYVGAVFIEEGHYIDRINEWLFPLFNASH